MHLERAGADPRSTCSHCVICCHCVMTSGSSPSTSIAPPNAAAATHHQSTSDVERWLDILVQEVEKLATLLSEAVLRAAATRFNTLASAAAAATMLSAAQPRMTVHAFYCLTLASPSWHPGPAEVIPTCSKAAGSGWMVAYASDGSDGGRHCRSSHISHRGSPPPLFRLFSPSSCESGSAGCR